MYGYRRYMPHFPMRFIACYIAVGAVLITGLSTAPFEQFRDEASSPAIFGISITLIAGIALLSMGAGIPAIERRINGPNSIANLIGIVSTALGVVLAVLGIFVQIQPDALLPAWIAYTITGGLLVAGLGAAIYKLEKLMKAQSGDSQDSNQ